MNQTIQILLVILLSCSIITVIRLWSVLGSARTTLENLETTRQEADRTLQRLSEVAISTDRVMREEVAPTLQQTRATLENVEATTRALAQTSQAIGRLTGHAETLTTAQRLFSMGSTLVQGFRGDDRARNGKARTTGFGIAFAAVSRLSGLFGIGKGKQEKQTAISNVKSLAPPRIDSPELPRKLPRKALPGADSNDSKR